MREMTDLSGLWRFQIDAYEDGEALGYTADSFDTRLWREVAVPCAFDDCGPEMAAYEGAGWFRRAFSLPEGVEKRHAVLRFEGVNYNARAWVNGQKAGEHRGGFLPFEISLDQFARPGLNSLAVRADNTRRKEEVPGRQRGWRPYGGILREVMLMIGDPLRLEKPVIRAEADGAFRVQVMAVNDRPEAARASLRVRVEDADRRQMAVLESGAQLLAPGGAFAFSLEGKIEATPWTPERPVLYTFVLELHDGRAADMIEARTGFRTIEARGTQLFLNGSPIYLKGFNRHEDSPRAGMAPDPETARRDLAHIKSLGCNFVRLCHYPHHPATLGLCDEMGVLAMGEIPLYWWEGHSVGEEAHRQKDEAARRQLREMIERDINHPSVIFWSVSNETSENHPEVAAGNAGLIALAKSLDPTRLAAHVSSHWPQHPHFEEDDILCVNAYPSWGGRGWENNAFYDFVNSRRWWEEHLARLHALHPDRPILITEYGYPAHRGVKGSALGDDAQAQAVLSEEKAFHAPYVCGHTLWCYADHPWPEEDFIKNLTISPFGIVTRDRREKPACAELRKREGILRAGPPFDPDTPGGPMVWMERPHLKDIPACPLPEGFRFRAFIPGDQGLWTDIQRDAEPFFPIAADLFDNQFGDDIEAACRRCFFIENERGCAVAAISAWYSRDYKGQDWGRVHWVATRPAYQRMGLARAGLSHTLLKLAEWHDRAYLSTSTGRVGAIRLYLDFGFLPDPEAPHARKAWAAFKEKVDHPGLAGI